MGLKGRIRRLEERHGLAQDKERCPDCKGKIIWGEEQADGTVVYPEGGGPCSTCESRPADGSIGRIIVCRSPAVGSRR